VVVCWGGGNLKGGLTRGKKILEPGVGGTALKLYLCNIGKAQKGGLWGGSRKGKEGGHHVYEHDSPPMETRRLTQSSVHPLGVRKKLQKEGGRPKKKTITEDNPLGPQGAVQG